jgi:uncharacterized membrane protein
MNEESDATQEQAPVDGQPGPDGPVTVKPVVAGSGQHQDLPANEADGRTAPVQTAVATQARAARQAPDPGRFHTGWWWWIVVVLLAAAAAFSSWIAVVSTFDHAHRLAAAVIALADVVVLAALFHVILVPYQMGAGILAGMGDQAGAVDQRVKDTLAYRRRGLKGAIIGQDGRASTSKTQVVLWTAAVLWALIDFLLLARAHPSGNFFASAVGSSWHPEYLVLLGFPLAAAAAAKAVVNGSNKGQGPQPSNQADVQQNQQAGAQQSQQASQLPARVYVRDPVPADVYGFRDGVAELITSDDGTVAWADLQYVVFTLITLVYFVIQVLAQPQDGLPAVPAALLTLMGVSASGYTAKKIVDAQGSVPKQAPAQAADAG